MFRSFFHFILSSLTYLTSAHFLLTTVFISLFAHPSTPLFAHPSTPLFAPHLSSASSSLDGFNRSGYARCVLQIETSHYGHSIWVDGRLYGRAPVPPLALNVGFHLIEIRSMGRVGMRLVWLTEGERLVISLGYSSHQKRADLGSNKEGGQLKNRRGRAKSGETGAKSGETGAKSGETGAKSGETGALILSLGSHIQLYSGVKEESSTQSVYDSTLQLSWAMNLSISPQLSFTLNGLSFNDLNTESPPLQYTVFSGSHVIWLRQAKGSWRPSSSTPTLVEAGRLTRSFGPWTLYGDGLLGVFSSQKAVTRSASISLLKAQLGQDQIYGSTYNSMSRSKHSLWWLQASGSIRWFSASLLSQIQTQRESSPQPLRGYLDLKITSDPDDPSMLSSADLSSIYPLPLFHSIYTPSKSTSINRSKGWFGRVEMISAYQRDQGYSPLTFGKFLAGWGGELRGDDLFQIELKGEWSEEEKLNMLRAPWEQWPQNFLGRRTRASSSLSYQPQSSVQDKKRWSPSIRLRYRHQRGGVPLWRLDQEMGQEMAQDMAQQAHPHLPLNMLPDWNIISISLRSTWETSLSQMFFIEATLDSWLLRQDRTTQDRTAQDRTAQDRTAQKEQQERWLHSFSLYSGVQWRDGWVIRALLNDGALWGAEKVWLKGGGGLLYQTASLNVGGECMHPITLPNSLILNRSLWWCGLHLQLSPKEVYTRSSSSRLTSLP